MAKRVDANKVAAMVNECMLLERKSETAQVPERLDASNCSQEFDNNNEGENAGAKAKEKHTYRLKMHLPK